MTKKKPRIGKAKVAKYVKRLAYAFSQFNFLKLTDEQQSEMLKDWYDVLSEFAAEDVESAVTDLIEAGSTFAPTLSEVVKASRSAYNRRKKRTYFRATGDDSDREKYFEARGQRLVRYTDDRTNTVIERTESADRCVWCATTQTYWPKIEFAIKFLGVQQVNEFLAPVVRFGGDAEYSFSSFMQDEKRQKQYLHVLDVMVDESRRVERERLQNTHSGEQFA